MDRGESTRAELVRVARELFAARGYAGVGTEELVRAARVTRGALYHHFADKRDLFRAVHEQVETELVESIGRRISAVDDPWELLVSGVGIFLDECTRPDFMQIALLDAPSVLGWKEWREVDERYGLALVSASLESAMDAGVLRRQELRPLSHLLLAVLGEAAFLVANADDPGAARHEVEPPLLALLEGLRRTTVRARPAEPGASARS
jgi:AcrR family transcriptional regulator